MLIIAGIIFLIIIVIIFMVFYLNRPETKNTNFSINFPAPIISPLPVINKELNPIIVIPGLGGTNLDYSIDENFDVSSCDAESLNSLKKLQGSLWVNPVGLLFKKTCFLNMLKPVYNEEDKTLNNLPGLKVFPFENYVGDPKSSICLAYLFNTSKCYPLTNYSKNFVDYFTQKQSYTPGYNLFIPGYDFRLVPYKEYATEYFNLIKELIERTYENTGKKIHLMGHSLGTLLGNMFLNKMSNKWKKCYIKDFISISPSYDGGPKSLRTCLSGYNFGLPDFIKVTNKDFIYAERNIAGLAATIPLLPEMYGSIKCETSCEKSCESETSRENTTSYAGNGEALTLLFNDKKVSYNVNDYKNGIIGLIENVTADVNNFTGNLEDTKYLDTLTQIMKPIAKERQKYAYTDPGVKVYQIIVQPVSTESSYLYDASKGFTEDPIYIGKVVGDNDIPAYGSKIPEIYGWKNVTNKIFPPLNDLNHYNAYVDSTVVYDYISEIINLEDCH